LVNLGNIHYLNNELKQAKEYYLRAYRKDPNNPTILVSLAKVNHELEEYGEAEETYNKLKAVSPELAQRFDYLALKGTGTARAGETAQERGIILWEEEE
jgi:Tfp pilus assembly protein PilF